MVPITSGAVLNLVGSVAEFALIAFLLSVRPITRLQVWLALLAGALATINIIGTLVSPLEGPWALAAAALAISFGVSLGAFALALPGRISRRMILAAALAGAVTGAIHASTATTDLGRIGRAFTLGPQTFFIVLAAARYRAHSGGEGEQKRQIVILSIGVASQFFGMGTRIDAQAGQLIATLAFILISSAAWLIVAARGSNAEARTARNLALFFPALVLVGIGAARLAGGPAEYPAKVGATSISNLWIVATFVYAIVRHQLLGIDFKLRWTISKSTIAAVFVAVFFVASEVAQQLFGAAFGGAYAGIIAAGALVFAMAPLQRAAERLAEKAVPIASVATGAPVLGAGTPSVVVVPPARAEASFRKAARWALRDRRITRAEETHLHELARDLGLDGARAHEILIEVEQELDQKEAR